MAKNSFHLLNNFCFSVFNYVQFYCHFIWINNILASFEFYFIFKEGMLKILQRKVVYGTLALLLSHSEHFKKLIGTHYIII